MHISVLTGRDLLLAFDRLINNSFPKMFFHLKAFPEGTLQYPGNRFYRMLRINKNPLDITLSDIRPIRIFRIDIFERPVQKQKSRLCIARPALQHSSRCPSWTKRSSTQRHLLLLPPSLLQLALRRSRRIGIHYRVLRGFRPTGASLVHRHQSFVACASLRWSPG